MLEQIHSHVPIPKKLRELRAVEVLELAGNREAQLALKEIAAGAPQARLTQEAKAALARLEKRSAAVP